MEKNNAYLHHPEIFYDVRYHGKWRIKSREGFYAKRANHKGILSKKDIIQDVNPLCTTGLNAIPNYCGTISFFQNSIQSLLFMAWVQDWPGLSWSEHQHTSCPKIYWASMLTTTTVVWCKIVRDKFFKYHSIKNCGFSLQWLRSIGRSVVPFNAFPFNVMLIFSM